ncbi:amidohydrolase family protein [Aliiglaciecola litoralis]|uniref:Amidohydrolase family protein n=1 Tax=Aliiglaciecola litoralis TaxID=582857 RepID=A0ABN1LDL4_9ALTE
MKNVLRILFWLVVGSVSVMALLIALPIKSPPLVGKKGDFALKNINVINTTNGNILRNKTVFIEQGKIAKIIPSNQYQPNASYIEIDGTGKYLMPGLWDIHTHSLKLSPYLHHPLFIANGVTSVRDMSGCLTQDDNYWACPQEKMIWEQQAIRGLRISPRYPLQSSYQTNGGNEVPEGFADYFRLNNLEDAQQLAAFYAKQNVDFVKTYTELTLKQFNHLVVATQQHHLAIAGHKPLAVSLEQVLDANVASIEHGRLFMFECFTGIASFRQHEDPISLYNAPFIREILNNQDTDSCDNLMVSMANTNTRWVPTLTTIKMSAMANEPSFRLDGRLEYIPYIVRKLLWEPDIRRASEQGNDRNGNFVHGDYYAAASAQVGRAQHLGVKVLAGTDNIDSYVFTGSSLHDELLMLVAAGLTHLQAIQAATINPAEFAGLGKDFGSVEINKQADLLLLNENPLSDIKHIADIYGVIFAGQYFDHAALETLEQYAAESAQSLQVNLRFLYDLLTSPLMRVQLAD